MANSRWTTLLLPWLSLGLLCSRSVAAPPQPPDPRDFGNGHKIPVENYCDQPRIVVTKAGTWVCVLTTSPGQEGANGQHVVVTTSHDQGQNWSPLRDIEPADEERKSAYALALLTPADRVYAFYCYNGDAIRTKPDGKPIRDDMQGWFCYRYSDDQGQSWSTRYRLPMPLSAADRTNDWQGKLQMFWAIGTPAVFDGKAVFGFTRLGKYILENGEGWFYRSDNILAESDPGKLNWQLLPDGECGLRSPDFGSVQEEFDVVHLQHEELCCVFRTTLGHAGCAYSRDGGHHWTMPEPLRYRPGGRLIKQPRACCKIWQTANGRYLLWFHNNSTTNYNNGLNAGSRNLAWLSAGRLQDGTLWWSEPELVAYVDGGLEGCSYPDLIEDHGQFYLCATQKTEARVMPLARDLLEGLWAQDSLRHIATNGLVLNLSGPKCAAQSTAPAPHFPALARKLQTEKRPPSGNPGLTLELTVRFSDLAPGQLLLDSRDEAGRGYLLTTTDRQTVRFEMCDGWQTAAWDCDPGLLKPGTLHHLVIGVDAGAKLIWFMVDGVLCDGGPQRQFGYGRFNPTFKDISGSRTLQVAPELHGELRHLLLYNRALRTSEAVGNSRALAP